MKKKPFCIFLQQRIFQHMLSQVSHITLQEIVMGFPKRNFISYLDGLHVLYFDGPKRNWSFAEKIDPATSSYTIVQEERKHREAEAASTQYLGLLLPFSQCATIWHSSHERILVMALETDILLMCQTFTDDLSIEYYSLYF